MADPDRTNRGFRVFARVPTQRGGCVHVQESSIAFEGAHVWLFLKGEQCSDHLGQHQKPDPHMNVEQARLLRAALDDFIREAESGELMEPASVNNG